MKILIADLDWIARDSIARLAVEIFPAVDVVLGADRAATLEALAAHPDIAIAIIDDAIVADDEDGLFTQIREFAPDVAIGVLALAADRERILKAIYFGAIAVILKNEERERVTHALSLLMSGEVVFPRHVLARGPGDRPAAAPAFDKRAAEDDLTPREREVIGLIGQGRTVAKIATALALSPHTVRVHVTRIMKKLDLRDRPALMHYAVIRSQAAQRAGETAH